MVEMLSNVDVEKDRSSIKRLLRYCHENGTGILLPETYYEEKVEGLVNYLIDKKALFFAVRDGKELVGFLWACEIKRDLEFVIHILYFAVDENFQGQGLGGMLLDAVRSEATRRGIRKMELNVRSMNHKAINFYKKNGFFEERVNMVSSL